MTGSTASQRAAVAVSFVVQAALIAVALAAVNSVSRAGQEATAMGPANASPLIAPISPLTSPMGIPVPVTIGIGGGSYSVMFPGTSQVPVAKVGSASGWTVKVTVLNLAALSNVQFTISAPGSAGRADVVSSVSELPPGPSQLMFVLPAADVPSGGSAAISMAATENGHEVNSTVLDIATAGTASKGGPAVK